MELLVIVRRRNICHNCYNCYNCYNCHNGLLLIIHGTL